MTVAARAYAEQQHFTAVSSATSIGLIVLSYERLLQHLHNAMHSIANGNDQGAVEPCTKAIDLIDLGLRASLNFEQGGEIALNLSSLYVWSISEILMARLKKDPERIASVIRVLEPLAQAWIAIDNRPAPSAVPASLQRI